MISVKETLYKNYGKCLCISNDSLEVYVTIDVGPRIIKCNLLGSENLMFEDIERKCANDVSSVFGPGKTFYNFGGHRMWLSPEKFPETYYPDCEKVLYTIHSTGASFVPPIQAVTGIQFSLSISMDETAPRFTVTHTVKNTNKKPLTGALWCLSVLGENGTVIVPEAAEDTGLLANRYIAVWPYTKLTDNRLFFGDRYTALRQDPTAEKPIKIGTNNTSGKLAYVKNGKALVKTYAIDENGEYPDNGCSFETYTGTYFIEAESLSPLKTMKTGESITHTEVWELFSDVGPCEMTNESLDSLAEKLF